MHRWINRAAVLGVGVRFPLVLLALATLMSGCQSTSTQDDPMAGLRCWAFRDEASITREQVDYIQDRSDKGNLKCKIMLGNLYERGHGVSRDIPKAKALYQAVADVDEQAYLFLADLAQSGFDGPPDYVKARQFYRRAAAIKDSASAELGLAKLMEEGKGGPQDQQGALALYLSATRSSFGEAWDGIQRLRARGVTLSAEQEQRYNQVWVGIAQSRLKRRMWRVQDEVSAVFKPGPEAKHVIVKVQYQQGSALPQLSIEHGSGDSAMDQAVLKGLGEYRFEGEPLLPPGRKTWEVLADVYLKSR